MEAKLKHLEFIQGVINRLSTDSFRMEGVAIKFVLRDLREKGLANDERRDCKVL